MKKLFGVLLLGAIFLGGVVFVWGKYSAWKVGSLLQNDQEAISGPGDLPAVVSATPSPMRTVAPVSGKFQPPLDRAKERVTKKPFGIFITKTTSPVQPERFSGFHAGTDFEIFPEEAQAEVVVKAICDGKLLLKKTASGYGGVAVQECELDSHPVTVVYGHLKLASLTQEVGSDLKTGEALGQLGAAFSVETDGERKHLHLGIHKGVGINLLGYVQAKNELIDWVDPCEDVCD